MLVSREELDWLLNQIEEAILNQLIAEGKTYSLTLIRGDYYKDLDDNINLGLKN